MAEVNIAFTFDRRILFGAAMSIRSLLLAANDSTEYAIHILHSDLTDKDRQALKGLLDKTHHKIFFYNIDKKLFKGVPQNGGSWTEIVYYRCIIPEILKDCDKVIYSDVDVFFKKDLSELFAENLDGFDFAAVRAERNTPDAVGHKHFPENKKDFIYWSGLMLLNCKQMRENGFFERVLQTAKAFGSRLKLFDLDAINITAQSIKPLDFSYVTLECIYAYNALEDAREYRFLKHVYTDSELESAKKSPAIIHYAGELNKPWQRPVNPKYWNDCAATIPPQLKKSTFRDFRKKLLYSGKKRRRLESLFGE